jgi:ankyrin repeat protein
MSALNPGVMNAKGTTFLRANHPAYALHVAAGNGHTSMVKFLIEEANANLEATDGDGDTALAWATWASRREVIDQLLAAGSNSSFVDSISRAQFEGVQGDGDSLDYLRKKHHDKK